MSSYNLTSSISIEEKYAKGLLPQRNNRQLFYSDTSCRSHLTNLLLTSENRRILRKTDQFTYNILPIYYNIEIQKQIFNWLKTLGWDFPISSVKNVFTHHLFNYLYIWKLDNQIVAYSVCYFDKTISHIGYVFYDPKYSHGDLPIRMVLQFVIDSADKKLDYAYLGRFANYKKNMPNFENFENNQWIKY